jgi:hypothetical protein
MPTDMALTAMRAFEAEVEIVIDLTLEKRRSKDRERQAKKRERDHVKSREATLQDVTDVTSRDQRDAKDAPAPVHTRGEDNLSRLVDTPNLTTLNASDAPDLDWPDGEKPSRAYLDQLEAALREAAGAALNPTSTRLFSLASILALGRTGKGPPCDLQADVLPTIRARSARAPPGTAKSWDFFTEAILEARDKRLSGARAVEPIHQGHRHERPHSSAKFDAKQANMERSFRAAQRVAGIG